MAHYFVRPVDRDCVPEGVDWYFLEEEGGDAHFVVARDAGAVEIPPQVLYGLLEKVQAAYQRAS